MVLPSNRWARLGLGLAAAALLALGIAQLVLPSIAERVLRDRVAKYGHVQSATLDAFPAIELLWGRADSATVRASHLRISAPQVVDLLLQSRAVDRLTVTAERLRLTDVGFGAGPLELTDARLVKSGEIVQGSAVLTDRALAAALPSAVSVTLLGDGEGGVKVRASGELLGLAAQLEAVVRAAEGKLLLTPTRPLLAGIAKVTLFDDPRLQVLSVSARPRAGVAGGAWLLSARARLR